MRPEFALTFPLAQTGDFISVKYPVLINPTTVLTPGTHLRIMYIITSAGDNYDDSDLALAHRGTQEEAYSRAAGGSQEFSGRLPPGLAHELEGYRRDVWSVPNNFVLAMAQYPTDQMHLIYSRTGKNGDISDARFYFFDGLFVGMPNGRVQVMAVEKESKAEEAGLKAGDEIITVGGIPTHDLSAFAAAYSDAKKTATVNEASTYPLTIHPAGTGDTKQVSIAMPPRISSGLMDGFH